MKTTYKFLFRGQIDTFYDFDYDKLQKLIVENNFYDKSHLKGFYKGDFFGKKEIK